MVLFGLVAGMIYVWSNRNFLLLFFRELTLLVIAIGTINYSGVPEPSDLIIMSIVLIVCEGVMVLGWRLLCPSMQLQPYSGDTQRLGSE